MMRTAKQTVRRGCLAIFALSLCCALVIGAIPALVTLTVDPYELLGERTRPAAVSELAEKDHYPLWKLARYRPGNHDTVILGDSRARALRDKYWHELGVTGAINLAYGGGTVPEIHATFNLIRNDPAIRNIVVGIQLRSLDERHKGGMNRVPEAVRLLGGPIEYLKNWSVAKTAFKVFKAENRQTLQMIGGFTPSLVTAASAAELGRTGKVPLQTLLSPDVCFACPLPQSAAPAGRRHYGRYAMVHLPRWRGTPGLWTRSYPSELAALYEPQIQPRALPVKIQRQVDRNGPADWRGFDISPLYWQHLEEIAAWGRQPGRTVIFVIPPTIAEMQATIHHHGLGALNIALRVELAKLGTVVDFDYPNMLTFEADNFSDAYHFRSPVARAIVGELAALLPTGDAVRRLAAKRRGILGCDGIGKTASRYDVSTEILMVDDKNCRNWSRRTL